MYAARAKRAAPDLPKGFVRATLLLLLLEQSAHGYELLERLEPFGFRRADAGGLYRNLRALEAAGLVNSDWEQSAAGPDRHVYKITGDGKAELHVHAKALATTLNLFVSRYLEFVDVTDPESPLNSEGEPAAQPSRNGQIEKPSNGA